MKKLLLLWLFSGSFDCFCQNNPAPLIDLKAQGWIIDKTPDTIRVTLIVYQDKGSMNILHTKPGFVIRQYGKEDIFLDKNKVIIKSPLEVFSYKIKK